MALIHPRSCGPVFFGAIAALCGCSEEDKNTPPISEVSNGFGSASFSGGGGVGDTGGDTMGDTGNGDTRGDTAGTSGTSVTTSSATVTPTGTSTDTVGQGGDANAFEGQMWLGEGEYTLPMECTVYFYLLDAIDPQTGTVFDEPQMFAPIIVEAWPQTFEIGWDHATPNVAQGDVGFVGVSCDIDGDLVVDDGVGGWYPEVPLEPVTAPATELVIEIGTL